MITVTPTPSQVANQGRADFVKSKFDDLIYQKGYDVVHEKALRCPCVSKNANQQSNCKNCGGSSWIFFNPTQTKMVIHSMNLNTKYKEWSQENIGTASISSLAETETSFMDRITVIDGEAIFSEVLFLKQYIPDEVGYFETFPMLVTLITHYYPSTFEGGLSTPLKSIALTSDSIEVHFSDSPYCSPIE